MSDDPDPLLVLAVTDNGAANVVFRTDLTNDQVINALDSAVRVIIGMSESARMNHTGIPDMAIRASERFEGNGR